MKVQTIQRREFLNGSRAEAKFTLGRITTEDEPSLYGDAPHISQLRVAWLEPDKVAEQWTADLYVCGIGPIGPIDLPFTYNVEQQVIVAVRPLATLFNTQTVMALLCDLPVSNHLYHATYLPSFARDTGIADIPRWVVAVTLYSGSGNFLDVAGNTIASVTTLGVPVARPQLAVQFQLSGENATTALFHY